jgi:hypothetical protein
MAPKRQRRPAAAAAARAAPAPPPPSAPPPELPDDVMRARAPPPPPASARLKRCFSLPRSPIRSPAPPAARLETPLAPSPSSCLSRPQAIAALLDTSSRMSARCVCKSWCRQLGAAVERLSVQPQFLGTPSGGAAGPSSRGRQAGGVTAAALLSAFPAASELCIELPLGDLPATGAQLASLARALGERSGGTLTALDIHTDETCELSDKQEAEAQRYFSAAMRHLLSRGALASLRRVESLRVDVDSLQSCFGVADNSGALSLLPALTDLRLNGIALDGRNARRFCASISAITQLRSLSMTFDFVQSPASLEPRAPAAYARELLALSALASLRRLRLHLVGTGLSDDVEEAISGTVQQLVGLLTGLSDLDVLAVGQLRLGVPRCLRGRLVALRAYAIAADEEEGAPPLLMPRLRGLSLSRLEILRPQEELLAPQLRALTIADLGAGGLAASLAWLRRQTKLCDLEAR